MDWNIYEGNQAKVGGEQLEKPNRGLSSNVLSRRQKSGYTGKWGQNNLQGFKGEYDWISGDTGTNTGLTTLSATPVANTPTTSTTQQWWMGSATPAVDYATQMQNNPYLNLFMNSTGNTTATAPTTTTDSNSWSSGNWELDPSYTAPNMSLTRRYKNKVTGKTQMVW